MSNPSSHQRRQRSRRPYQLPLLLILTSNFDGGCRHKLACCDAAADYGHNGVVVRTPSFRHRRRWVERPSFLGSSQSRSSDFDGSISTLRGGGGSGVIAPSSDKQPAAEASASSSNEPSSPFEYIPITALDNYGQSAQLRHAMESATRFGTPVLACICRIDSENKEEEKEGIENAIVVCSLQRPRPGVISSSPTISSISSNNKSIIHPSIQGMVKPVATRDDIQTTPRTHHLKDIPNHAIHTAIVTTGISSDANFLLAQLQSHISKYWFRYDALPSTSGATSSLTVIKMVRDVLLDCMGYDWSEELASARVSGGIGSAAPSYDDQEGDEDGGGGGQRAGRPLGVCTFLLGLDHSTKAHPFLTVIKANGSSQQYVAHAMGAGSQLANEKLSQRWKRCMSEKEAKDMMREILNDVAEETGWLPGDEKYGRAERNGIDGLTVACETVTSGGIDVEYLPL